MDAEKSQKFLYTALADELLAAYQYWVCKNLSRGAGKSDVDAEFDEHAKEEMAHADAIMLRLKELGGAPIPDPKDWETFANPWKPVEFRNVREQLLTTINAEKAAIDFYEKAIAELRDIDETTHRLFRDILADEEKHLYDLKELLAEYDNVEAFVAKRKTARKRLTSRTL